MLDSGEVSLFSKLEKVFIASIGLIAFIFGVVGYQEYFESENIQYSVDDLFYFTIKLFLMDIVDDIIKPPTPLAIARWLAPTAFSYTVIKALLAVTHHYIYNVQIKYLADHAVIIGLNPASVISAKSFYSQGIKTLVVDQDAKSPLWGVLRHAGIHMLVLNPLDKTLLDKVNLKQAKYLLACTQNDSVNFEVIYSAYQFKQSSSSTSFLNSACFIEDNSLYDALYNRPMFTINRSNFASRIVDNDKIAVRLLLNTHGPDCHIENIKALTTLKIAVLGDDTLVKSLIERIAEIGIYSLHQQIEVVIVGQKTEDVYRNLLSEHHLIEELISIRLLNVMRFNRFNIEAISDSDIIYLCTHETDKAVLALQSLIDLSFERPIITVETDHRTSFKWLQDEYSANSNVHFAWINQATHDQENIFSNKHDKLAISIHNRYLKKQQLMGLSEKDNESLVEWDWLPEVLKNTNRNQADHIPIKCRLLTDKTHPSPAEITAALTDEVIWEFAELEHRRWLAEKKMSGWRYSHVKQTEKRLSPSIKCWEDLTEEEKQLDADTVRQLPELVNLLN